MFIKSRASRFGRIFVRITLSYFQIRKPITDSSGRENREVRLRLDPLPAAVDALEFEGF